MDTAAKRASALGAFKPFLTLVTPDSIDQGDRQTVALMYGGILAEEAVTVEITPYYQVQSNVKPIELYSKEQDIRFDSRAMSIKL